jgi:hypothetical protein
MVCPLTINILRSLKKLCGVYFAEVLPNLGNSTRSEQGEPMNAAVATVCNLDPAFNVSDSRNEHQAKQ